MSFKAHVECMRFSMGDVGVFITLIEREETSADEDGDSWSGSPIRVCMWTGDCSEYHGAGEEVGSCAVAAIGGVDEGGLEGLMDVGEEVCVGETDSLCTLGRGGVGGTCISSVTYTIGWVKANGGKKEIELLCWGVAGGCCEGCGVGVEGKV